MPVVQTCDIGTEQDAGCELCHSSAVREICSAADRLNRSDRTFSIAICEGCGVLRTLPEMSDAELAPFYPEDYWGEDSFPPDEWIRSSQSEKTAFLARCGLNGGRILDVGCGGGHFLRALGSESWDRYGVETGRQACSAASSWLGSDRVVSGTLTEAGFPDSAFDLVTFWSALEHSTRPRATLLEARRIVKPGGSLVVQVPNADSYQAAMFGGDWFALDAPRHRYHFTPERLQRLLNETGFQIRRATFFSKQHNAHSLRQSLKVRLRAADSRLGMGLFLFSIPFIKPVDLALTVLGRGATMTVAANAV